MIAALVPMLFAAAACLALGTIALSWRVYGAQALSLRQELAAWDPVREVHFMKITTHVRVETQPVWRPGFSSLASRQHRQNQRPALRAAA